MKFGLRNVRPTGLPHWSEMRLAYGRTKAAPSSFMVDYLHYLPDDLGMMGNDSVGDCFFAAQYHGRQLRTLMTTGTMDTEPTTTVLEAYSAATGYQDGNPATDQGTDPAQGFAWITKNGLPLASGAKVDLLGAFEVDPRQPADCVSALDYCGGLSVGLTIPQRLAQGDMGDVWDWLPSDTPSNEGHEVLVGRMDVALSGNVGLISWGSKRYEMTPVFWNAAVNQVTAVVYRDWFEATGLTPFNMTPDQLAAEMAKYASGAIP